MRTRLGNSHAVTAERPSASTVRASIQPPAASCRQHVARGEMLAGEFPVGGEFHPALGAAHRLVVAEQAGRAVEAEQRGFDVGRVGVEIDQDQRPPAPRMSGEQPLRAQAEILVHLRRAVAELSRRNGGTVAAMAAGR